jgi:hypothetical protein
LRVHRAGYAAARAERNSMILEVLFIVFLVFAFISAYPGAPVPPYTGFLCLCVAVLCLGLHAFRMVNA